MSTARTWQTESTRLDDTLALAARIGRKLKGGEVIELVGDLGSGKTAFVRGLAEGMGSKDRVSSPSFTLNNEYKAGDLTLHHFDFYRLDEPGVMKRELEEILNDPKAVVVIEWADITYDILQKGRLLISFLASSEVSRSIKLQYSEKLSYLIGSN